MPREPRVNLADDGQRYSLRRDGPNLDADRTADARPQLAHRFAQLLRDALAARGGSQ
jgi:hypothetical protein